MSNENTILALIQLLNTVLGLTRQLGVRLTPLAQRLDALEAEGKDLSAEELAELVAGLRTELDGLEGDVEARKAGQLPII